MRWKVLVDAIRAARADKDDRRHQPPGTKRLDDPEVRAVAESLGYDPDCVPDVDAWEPVHLGRQVKYRVQKLEEVARRLGYEYKREMMQPPIISLRLGYRYIEVKITENEYIFKLHYPRPFDAKTEQSRHWRQPSWVSFGFTMSTDKLIEFIEHELIPPYDQAIAEERRKDEERERQLRAAVPYRYG